MLWIIGVKIIWKGKNIERVGFINGVGYVFIKN